MSKCQHSPLFVAVPKGVEFNPLIGKFVNDPNNVTYEKVRVGLPTNVGSSIQFLLCTKCMQIYWEFSADEETDKTSNTKVPHQSH